MVVYYAIPTEARLWWLACLLAAFAFIVVASYRLRRRRRWGAALGGLTRLYGRVIGPGEPRRPVLVMDGEVAWPLPTFHFEARDGQFFEVDARSAALLRGHRARLRGKAWRALRVGDRLSLEGEWISVARGESTYRSAATEQHFRIGRLVRGARRERGWLRGVALVALVVAFGCGAAACTLEHSYQLTPANSTRWAPIDDEPSAEQRLEGLRPAAPFGVLNCVGAAWRLACAPGCRDLLREDSPVPR